MVDLFLDDRTNGGPGCSSMEGLLQENGVSKYWGWYHLGRADHLVYQPFSWSLGQAKPTPNEFSWTNLSSLLFVEQPVGTGFSQGVPTARVSVSYRLIGIVADCVMPLERK